MNLTEKEFSYEKVRDKDFQPPIANRSTYLQFLAICKKGRATSSKGQGNSMLLCCETRIGDFQQKFTNLATFCCSRVLSQKTSWRCAATTFA